MTYPFIGKFQSAVKIFFNHGSSAVIESGHGVARHESNFKNITAEYLANTYGEVKSKEHAHFIVELGEGAGYELVGSISPNNAGVFVFDGENKTLFFMLGGGSLRGGSALKQITIPLPPECESSDKAPLEVISNGAIYKLSEGGFYALTGNGKAGVIYESTSLDNLMKAEDFRVLSFATDNAGKEDNEWPKVGSKVTWIEREVVGVVKCIDNGWAWILCPSGSYTQQKVSILKKPKTPDEKLRDEIASLLDSYVDSEKTRGYFVNKILELTKKPQ